MLIQKIRLNNIGFEGHKELLDKVDTDFYTGKVVDRQHRTVEHILPKSKGGMNDIKNYAMTDIFINTKRTNTDLKKWLTIHPEYLENMRNYINKYWNTLIDHVFHGREVNKTVKKLINIDLHI